MEFDGLLFFFSVIAIGFGAAKARLLPSQALDVLPSVLFNICYPAMVLHTFTTTDTDQLFTAGLPVVLSTVAITGVLFAGSLLLYRRAAPSRKALLCFMSGIGNVTYVAIPLLSVFLHEEGLFIAVVHGAVQDLLIWSLYQQLFLAGSCTSSRELAKKVMTSPCLLAALAGVALALLQIPLPSFLQMTIARLSSTTSPMALLFLGMLIQHHGLFSWRRDRLSMIFALCKVVLLPCLLFAVLHFFLPLQVAILLALLFGSPAPLMVVIWAKQYGGDQQFAVHCCVCSTLLFLVVMSCALLLLTTFGILTI